MRRIKIIEVDLDIYESFGGDKRPELRHSPEELGECYEILKVMTDDGELLTLIDHEVEFL